MNWNTIPRQDLPLDDKPALLVGDEDRNPDRAEFEKARQVADHVFRQVGHAIGDMKQSHLTWPNAKLRSEHRSSDIGNREDMAALLRRQLRNDVCRFRPDRASSLRCVTTKVYFYAIGDLSLSRMWQLWGAVG